MEIKIYQSLTSFHQGDKKLLRELSGAPFAQLKPIRLAKHQ